MTHNSSATAPLVDVLSNRAGLWWGLLGVAAFSLTVPATRVVVTGGMSPLFVGSARAVVAAILAAAVLLITRQPFPSVRQLRRLLLVAGGVVVGFPLLTTYALTATAASHGAVVIALLPAATAVTAALRTREKVSMLFWVMAGVGAVAAIVFAALSGGGLGGLQQADLLLFGAVVAAAVGYAEGGLLARELGAWQTVSWALVLCSPVMIILTVVSLGQQWPTGTATQWTAFGYLGVVSMFLGFFAWYRGLAIGPMTQVSQIQLVQPVMTIGWAALLLGEHVTWLTLLGGAAVIICAAVTVRTRVRNVA